MARRNLIERRPAESGAQVVAALVAVLTLALNLRPAYSAPLIVVVGAIPSGITYFVDLRKRLR